MRGGRAWLRERGPVTLAAALLLEVSSGTPASGPVVRALLRAAALLLLLFVVLVIATLDGVVSRLASAARTASVSAERWVRTTVLGDRAPVPVPAALLHDRAGRPLRGAVRAARIAAIVREQEREARARSLRGRAVLPYARARSVVGPYLRDLAARAASLEARAISARAAALAESRATIEQLRPGIERALAPLGALAPLQAQGTRLARGVVHAFGRREAAAIAVPAARYAGVARARLVAVPVPSFPLPRLSLGTVRIVTVAVLFSFVFATVIGTTGLVANRGSVALSASTTLAIISGEVSVRDEGAAEFRAAADGEVLQAGMTIRTASETYAILTYFEGSTVSIDPETTLVIETLQANPDGSTVIGMRQDVGNTWHAVTKLLTAGSKYEVRTPTATATVRGTMFALRVLPSLDLGLPETVIETTEGAVAAERAPTPETPEGEEIIVPAGFTVTAKPAAAIPPAVPAAEPERTVTVTVGRTNSLVVDPQGRANGEKDGKVVVQTPGATVERVDGKIVVTLPNISDGKVSTVIQPTTQPVGAPPQAPVEVVTVVAERGKGESTSTETVTPKVDAPGVTGIELKKSADPDKPADVRKLDETEKQEAPAPKVAEAPKPPAEPKQERSEGEGGTRGESQPAKSDEEGKRQSVVQSIVSLTLPPLSAEELARREDDKRKADERAREEQRRRDEERRAADEKRIQELREVEERAKQNVTRIGDERQREETKADDRRRSEGDRREETRREDERAGTPTAEPPVVVIQQIIRAITPDSDSAKRDEDKKIDELRRAEEKAKQDAQKAEDERRKAEERARTGAIRAEEEKKKDAERRSEELRRAEERAKQDETRKLEELRRIEEKAREQAAKLEQEQRREAEKRLQEFREAEERRRRDETRQLEEQRRAEERAREDAERRLRELRRDEERAREEQRERERERELERERGRDERRGGFAPTETLKPLPGVGSRSADEKDRSEQRQEQGDQQERARARGED